MRRHHGDRLRDVERRTAADADDAVRAMLAVGARARRHLAAHGIAGHAGEHGGRERLEFGEDAGEDGQGGEAAVGYDERARKPALAQVRRDFAARSGAEQDGRGKGEAVHAGVMRRVR